MRRFFAVSALTAVIALPALAAPTKSARPEKFENQWSVPSELGLYEGCRVGLSKTETKDHVAAALCVCLVSEIEDLVPETAPDKALDDAIVRANEICVKKLNLKRVEPEEAESQII